MDKPNVLLKVIAKNIHAIAALNSYSVIDKDIILQYLRTTYGVIVQISPNTESLDANIILENVLTDEHSATALEEIKGVLAEKEREMQAQMATISQLTAEIGNAKERLASQDNALEGKEELIAAKNIQIEQLSQQLQLQKELFDSEKKDLNLQIEMERSRAQTAAMQVTPVATEPSTPITMPEVEVSAEKEEEKVPVTVLQQTETVETTTIVTEEMLHFVDESALIMPETLTEEVIEKTSEVEETVVTLEVEAPAADLFTPPVQETIQTVQKEVTVTVKRSLSDYLGDNKEDNSLGSRYQNSKINDLTKAISINDKFLFIRELFNQKGDEFKASVEQLNQCANDEQAFALLEKLRHHYFWDTSSPAYLSFCDLIRRKFN